MEELPPSTERKDEPEPSFLYCFGPATLVNLVPRRVLTTLQQYWRSQQKPKYYDFDYLSAHSGEETSMLLGQKKHTSKEEEAACRCSTSPEAKQHRGSECSELCRHYVLPRDHTQVHNTHKCNKKEGRQLS